MNTHLENLCISLDTLSSAVLSAWTDNRSLNEAHGWNHPALTRQDLAHIPQSIAQKIREANINELDEDLEGKLHTASQQILHLKKHTIPHMFNGNGNQAVPAFLNTLDWVNILLQPLFGWQVIQDNKMMPTNLARKLRSVEAELNEIVPQKEELKKQIELIESATYAAESLPTDLESLKEARNKIVSFSTESIEAYSKINECLTKASNAFEKISIKTNESEKLVQQCEEAYRITTTKGLAAAFDQRAIRLNWSMWIWVIGLLIALIVGGILGANRISSLTVAINSNSTNWGIISMNIILSILSIGGPLWFAWLATKQISHIFKLSEDYAFKASVAKAYEGYKKEAASISEDFEARLFGSALSRLEEAPLRLLNENSPGSPWHELIKSDGFQKAIATVPEFRDKIFELAKEGISKTKKSKNVDQSEVKLE